MMREQFNSIKFNSLLKRGVKIHNELAELLVFTMIKKSKYAHWIVFF